MEKFKNQELFNIILTEKFEFILILLKTFKIFNLFFAKAKFFNNNVFFKRSKIFPRNK